MAYSTTAAAIAAELESVTDIGSVHTGERHIRDADRLNELFGADSETAGGGRILRGWTIARESIVENWWTGTRTLSIERWVLTGIGLLLLEAGSESEFQDMVGRVWAQFRGLKTVGDATWIDALTTPTFSATKLSGRACHLAQIVLGLAVVHTIGVQVETPPGHVASTVSDRAIYGATSEQIAAYLETIAEAGKVYPERRYATTRQEKLDLFTATFEGIGRDVRSWQVFRQSDEERRSVGLRSEGVSSWALQGARTWRVGANTYEAFQAHIDDVAAMFRRLPNLGNTTNRTQSRSTPLQVVEIGARAFGGETLVHFGDCRIETTEVVHAVAV